jgi:hypothetical protein
MKRAAILLLVLAASCFYRPTFVERHPGDVLSGGNRPGSVNPAPATPHAARGVQPCVEIARRRCAVDTCKGANMDYVTLSCSGGKEVKRCVANTECSAD